MSARFVGSRVPLVDLKTGLCAPIWYRFFEGMFETGSTGGTVPDTDGFLVSPANGSADDALTRIGTLSNELNQGGLLPPAAPENIAQFLDLAPPSPEGGVFSISFGTTGLTPATATKGAITVAGTLIPPNGGTGLSTYTAGDMIYATGAATLAKLPIGANNYVLTSNGTAPVWTPNTGTGNAVRATQPQFTTTIGVGAPASASGSGISFPATQAPSTDPNTLDDYEEGVWSPSVTAAAGTITTLGAVSGSYTKIGRTVKVWVIINITTNGTGAGNVIAAGLPFTPVADSDGTGRERNVTGNQLQAIITAGSASLQLVTYNNLYPGGNGYRLTATAEYYV